MATAQVHVTGVQYPNFGMRRNYGIITVSKDWLFDTITAHQVKPITGKLDQSGQFIPISNSVSDYTVEAVAESPFLKEKWHYGAPLVP